MKVSQENKVKVKVSLGKVRDEFFLWGKEICDITLMEMARSIMKVSQQYEVKFKVSLGKHICRLFPPMLHVKYQIKADYVACHELPCRFAKYKK